MVFKTEKMCKWGIIDDCTKSYKRKKLVIGTVHCVFIQSKHQPSQRNEIKIKTCETQPVSVKLNLYSRSLEYSKKSLTQLNNLVLI